MTRKKKREKLREGEGAGRKAFGLWEESRVASIFSLFFKALTMNECEE